MAAAEKYAQGCLDEYEKWCNGECYGYVVGVYRQTDGQLVTEDSCWGYIGYEYAERELREVMRHYVEKYREVAPETLTESEGGEL